MISHFFWSGHHPLYFCVVENNFFCKIINNRSDTFGQELLFNFDYVCWNKNKWLFFSQKSRFRWPRRKKDAYLGSEIVMRPIQRSLKRQKLFSKIDFWLLRARLHSAGTRLWVKHEIIAAPPFRYNDKNSCQKLNFRRRAPLMLSVRTKIHYYTLCLKSTTINGRWLKSMWTKFRAREKQNEAPTGRCWFFRHCKSGTSNHRTNFALLLPFYCADRLCTCIEHGTDREFVWYCSNLGHFPRRASPLQTLSHRDHMNWTLSLAQAVARVP